MAAHINHAEFIKIAAMDRTRGWAEAGYRQLARPPLRPRTLRRPRAHPSCEGQAPARAALALPGCIGRALARLPHIDAAFRDGVLSYSNAITRVATRESEAVLHIAGSSSAAQLESLAGTSGWQTNGNGCAARSGGA